MRPIELREDAIQLYLQEHISYRDIAERLDVPRDTIKSWIRRYRDANGLIVNGTRQQNKAKKVPDNSGKQSCSCYEKRIQQLEMEVELLRDFLAEEERRSIKK